MPDDHQFAPKRAASRLASFGHAFAGVAYLFRTQRNAWIHIVATVCVVVLGVWLGISRVEWGLIALVIGLVWLAESVNTAFETIVDLASPDWHPLAKIAKDVAAAAVLIAALTAVIIGLAIFGPPLWHRFATAA